MPTLELTACTVDLATGVLTRPGTPDGRLSLTERRLLAHLVANEGRVVSRSELLRVVWHWRARAATRAADAAVLRLRRRVEEDPARPDHLFTIHGVGYRFVSARRPEPVVLLPGQPVTRVDGDPSAVAAGLRDGGAPVYIADVSGVTGRCLAYAVARAVGLPAVDDDAGLTRALAELETCVLVLGPVPDDGSARIAGWVRDGSRVRIVVAGRGGGGPCPRDPVPVVRTALHELRRTGLLEPYSVLGAHLPALDATAESSAERALLTAEVAAALGLPNVRAAAAGLAVAAAEKHDDPVTLALALYVRAVACPGGALADVARAEALGVDDSSVELARALAELAASWRSYDPHQQLLLAPRLAALAEKAGRPDLVREARHLAARALEWEGRYAEALVEVVRLRAACDASGYRAFTQTYGATALLTRARLATMEEVDDEVDMLVAASRSAEVAPIAPTDLIYLASVLLWVGRDAEARALTWEAGELARRHGRVQARIAAVNNLGVCDWLAGRWGRAAERFAQVLVESAGGDDVYRGVALLNLAAVTREGALLVQAEPLVRGDPHFAGHLAARRLLADDDDAAFLAAQDAAVSPELREVLPVYRALQLLRRGDAAAALAVWAAAPSRPMLQTRMGLKLLEHDLTRRGLLPIACPT